MIEKFDSWTDFVDHAVNRTTEMWADECSSRLHSRDGFRGGTFEEIVNLARAGWIDGVERIQKDLKPLFDKVTSKVMMSEPYYAPVGPGTLAMGRYNMGHPKPFLRMRESEIEADSPRGDIIHIVVNGFVSSGVSRDAIFTRGAAIVALIDVLESGGRRIELDLVFTAYGHGIKPSSEVWVRIKGANDPVNLENIAMALAHSGTFRGLTFSVYEGMPAAERKKIGVPGYYGSPGELMQDRGDIYIPCASLDNPAFKSESRTVQWVLDILKSQGIHVEE